MNTLKTIQKSFMIVGGILLFLTLALGIFCRMYWGGVSTPETAPQNTVVNLGDSITLDDILAEANYHPYWVKSDTIGLSIALEDGRDGTCLLAYDEMTRTFSATGCGNGEIILDCPSDKAVSFRIPFCAQFRADCTAHWLVSEAMDKAVTADEIDAVTQIDIFDANDLDLSDLMYFPNLRTVVIDANADVLPLENMDKIAENIVFLVPKAKYEAYAADSRWSSFSHRMFPNMESDGNILVFDLDGGTLSGATTVGDCYFELRSGEESLNPSHYAISKTGYTFEGWKVSYDGGKHFSETASDSTVVKSNMKLYAQWRENEYTIHYHMNGSATTPGTIPSHTVKYSEASAISSTQPERKGYTFRGWSDSANSTEIRYRPGERLQSVTATDGASVDLYAVWEANEYALYYYELSNSTYASKQGMVYDEAITILDVTSKRPGYRFLGWAVEQGSSQVEYKPGQSVKNIASEDGSRMSLYAVWEPIQYTVKFVDLADKAMDLPLEFKVTYDQAFHLPSTTPTRLGHTFLGWSTDVSYAIQLQDSLSASSHRPGDQLSNLSTQDNGVVTMYAVWQADTFTLKLHPNTGNGSERTLTITYGKPYTFDPDWFNKGNNVLRGYAKSSSSKFPEYSMNELNVANVDDLYQLSLTSNKTVTLYAVWYPTYTIRYNSDGGTTTPNLQTAVVGEFAYLAPPVVKPGYVFNGWTYNGKLYAAREGVKDLTTKAGTEIVMKAEWKPITYTVTYDLNSGSGSIADMEMKYGEIKKLAAAPTREGHVFVNWEYDGNYYAAGEMVINLTTENESTITMRAVWGPKP